MRYWIKSEILSGFGPLYNVHRVMLNNIEMNLVFPHRMKKESWGGNRWFILRLPLRPYRQSEDVGSMLNKRSWIYIFQNCQVFHNLMESFWIIRLYIRYFFQKITKLQTFVKILMIYIEAASTSAQIIWRCWKYTQQT